MKKIVKNTLFIFIICIIFLLTSCVDLSDIFSESLSDHDTADRNMDQLIACIETKNKEGLKELCASAQMGQSDTYESDIEELFAYYEGYYISKVGTVSTGEYSNYDYAYKRLGMSYDVTTSIRTYRFCIGWYLKDSRGKQNIGIWYLYVLKYEEDEYSDMGYGGDGTFTSGIHVGVHQNPN